MGGEFGLITTVVSALSAFGGIAYAVAREKAVPDSVSGIAYIMPHWAFSMWIACTAMLLMPRMMELLPQNEQWIGFVSVVGAFIVASSSFYKSEAKGLHYIGGCICAVFAIVATSMIKPMMLLLFLPVLLILLKLKSKEWLFWTELAIYVVLTTTLLI